MSNGKSPIKDFMVISGGSLLNLLIGLLTTPIITRLVDPEEYGQLSIFNLYANIAVLIFCIGLDQALVRFYYNSDRIEYKREIVYKSWSIPLIIWLLFCIPAFFSIKLGFIPFEFNVTILFILIAFVAIQIVNRIAVLVLRLEYQSTKYTFVNVVNKVVYTGIAIILVKLIDKEYLLLLTISTTFAYFVSLVLAIKAESKIWRGGQSRTNTVDIIKLMQYGAPFILSMGITTVFQGIDKMSLNHYCSYSEVGIYSSAMSLVHIFAILQSSFNAIWAPMATEHYEKNKTDTTFYKKGNAYITILMFFLGLCLILVKDIFAVLLGEKYREAAYILPCLCFNPIMYTISETTVSGINFKKKSYLHILVASGACVVNIIGNTILVPIISGRGAAISTGISYIVFFSLRTIISNRLFKVDFQIWKLATLTMITLVYAIYNTFVKFNALTVVGFVICIVTLFGLYNRDVVDGLRIVVSMIRSKLKID